MLKRYGTTICRGMNLHHMLLLNLSELISELITLYFDELILAFIALIAVQRPGEL